MTIYEILSLTLLFFEALAMIVGFICWKYLKPTYWKLCPIFLLIIVINEIIGNLLRYVDVQANMEWYSFIVIPLQFLFYYFLFFKFFKQRNLKIMSIAFSIIYFIAFLIDNFSRSNNDYGFSSISYTVGNLFMPVLIFTYFLQLLKSPQIFSFTKEPMFWISNGLLLSYLGGFPLYAFQHSMGHKYPDFFNNLWIFVILLDCISFLMFTYSFICFKWNPQSSSS